MSDNLPDYTAVEPPDDKSMSEYDHHERRALLLRLIKHAGSPFAVNQADIAERCGVHRSTICRDMDALREAIAEHIGEDAKLTTRALFEKTVRELQNEGEWKAAWDVTMDWNNWLADIGEQEREPARVEADVRSAHAEVAYTVVRDGEDGELPTTEDGDVDHEALGFSKGPVAVEATEPPSDGGSGS
jgi:AcrR family transcriptional regulator